MGKVSRYNVPALCLTEPVDGRSPSASVGANGVKNRKQADLTVTLLTRSNEGCAARGRSSTAWWVVVSHAERPRGVG